MPSAHDLDGTADELLRTVLDHHPVLATLQGIPGHDGRLTDHGEEAEARFTARLDDLVRRAEAVDPGPLDRTGRVTRDTIVQQAGAHREQVADRWVEFTISDLVLTPVPLLLYALAEAPDEGRRAGLPAHFRALADRHRAGVAHGRLPVRRLVEAAIALLDRNADLPGVAEYRSALVEDVLPHGRPDDRAGVCHLPGGDRLYANAIRRHTTTDLTPDRLHRTGLEVMAALEDEYRELGREVFGTSDLAAVFAGLRDAPRFAGGEEVRVAAERVVRRAEAAAPGWFHQPPEHPCEVRLYPPGTSAATPPSYRMGAVDGSRPGTFSVNPGQPVQVHALEALTFHETVPGHHVDGSARLRRTDLPLLRRVAGLHAYSEGWALYAERLADEMGLYTDARARLGMLVFDSMRAGRLVVDTGLHAFGWSRARAVEFLLTTTPMAAELVEAEVDRYLADPGQALAYMVGRLELQRLRAGAERRLGGAFDVRDFHEVVLSEARVPLSTLGDLVEEWVQSLVRRR
ncbi:DUF885 domain-containing protein [Saccharothrix xinjiangensis]|uniref:DUF885 domain-containing protein n=1 Tax=Saccharothrix xinjiangensis TaxID=204798 RepID=A0ABV9YCE3_9PSEU